VGGMCGMGGLCEICTIRDNWVSEMGTSKGN
jgi:hypothetical protein